MAAPTLASQPTVPHLHTTLTPPTGISQEYKPQFDAPQQHAPQPKVAKSSEAQPNEPQQYPTQMNVPPPQQNPPPQPSTAHQQDGSPPANVPLQDVPQQSMAQSSTPKETDPHQYDKTLATPPQNLPPPIAPQQNLLPPTGYQSVAPGPISNIQSPAVPIVATTPGVPMYNYKFRDAGNNMLTCDNPNLPIFTIETTRGLMEVNKNTLVICTFQQGELASAGAGKVQGEIDWKNKRITVGNVSKTFKQAKHKIGGTFSQ
jgi:hypothetical protein